MPQVTSQMVEKMKYLKIWSSRIKISKIRNSINAIKVLKNKRGRACLVITRTGILMHITLNSKAIVLLQICFIYF